MSANKTVLMVSMDVRGARRELALDLLLSGTGIVMMGRSLARLTKSSLVDIAHSRRLEWVVVDDAGPETIQLWPPT